MINFSKIKKNLQNPLWSASDGAILKSEILNISAIVVHIQKNFKMYSTFYNSTSSCLWVLSDISLLLQMTTRNQHIALVGMSYPIHGFESYFRPKYEFVIAGWLLTFMSKMRIRFKVGLAARLHGNLKVNLHGELNIGKLLTFTSKIQIRSVVAIWIYSEFAWRPNRE